MRTPRWDRCVNHRGRETVAFLQDYFGDASRRVLVVGGAGFDPRSTYVADTLVAAAAERVRGFFLREERPRPAAELTRRAERHVEHLQRTLRDCQIRAVDIFASDGAVVGGRRAVRELERVPTADLTDIVVDLSALSVGVAFPLVRCLVEGTHSANVHVVVTDETATDLGIRSTPADAADTIFGFKGGLTLMSQNEDAARLWLPQLVEGRRVILDRIHTSVRPDDVCPILPFPASDPRRADRLIEEYREELESVWGIDAHDIVYADERDPLDLYRTILRMDELRAVVFKETGGSLTILSPMGSKVLSIGALMAAMERKFPVVHVESVGYSVEFDRVDEARRGGQGDLVHLWLRDETQAR